MRAAMSSSALSAKLLLQAGADPHHINTPADSALHYAATYSDNRDVLQYLTTAGVDIDGQGHAGATPLSRATLSNNTEAAKLLLACRANINSLDKENDTPLHESLFRQHDDMTKLLLSHGASYTLPDSLGNSVLHLAALSGGLRTLEILHTAALRGIDTEATDKQGKTALRLAQQREGREEGFLEKFQELLVDIRTRNAAQAQETNRTNDENVSTALGDPSYTEFRVKTLLARAFWFITAFFWSTLEKIRDLRGNNPLTLDRSMWTSILIYWVLGLGWVGFIYVIFFGPGLSGRKS